MKTCFKHQKYPSFSLSERNYFSQFASGYPVLKSLTHLFEGHFLRVAEASLSNLPNMAGTGRVIGRVKVAKRSNQGFFFLFTLRAVQGEVRVQDGDAIHC